jgi:hypothetical protein
MKKLTLIVLLFLASFPGKSQVNFSSVDLMILEKAPATTYSHMNQQLEAKSENSAVIKKANVSGGESFFMYYKNNLSITINYSKDTLVVSAIIPSEHVTEIEHELLENKFDKRAIKSYKNSNGDVLKRYKWSKQGYPYRFITYDNFSGIELLTSISDEY